MRRHFRGYTLLLLVFALCGCVHSNYSGALSPGDVFEVQAVAGAVLGERRHGVFDGYSYHRLGRYRAGAVEFDAATESRRAETFGDEDSGAPVYDNLRTIHFQGRGGRQYLLRPLPEAGSAVLAGTVSLNGRYSGYEVLDTFSNRVVLRVH